MNTFKSVVVVTLISYLLYQGFDIAWTPLDAMLVQASMALYFGYAGLRWYNRNYQSTDLMKRSPVPLVLQTVCGVLFLLLCCFLVSSKVLQPLLYLHTR